MENSWILWVYLLSLHQLKKWLYMDKFPDLNCTLKLKKYSCSVTRVSIFHEFMIQKMNILSKDLCPKRLSFYLKCLLAKWQNIGLAFLEQLYLIHKQCKSKMQNQPRCHLKKNKNTFKGNLDFTDEIKLYRAKKIFIFWKHVRGTTPSLASRLAMTWGQPRPNNFGKIPVIKN